MIDVRFGKNTLKFTKTHKHTKPHTESTADQYAYGDPKKAEIKTIAPCQAKARVCAKNQVGVTGVVKLLRGINPSRAEGPDKILTNAYRADGPGKILTNPSRADGPGKILTNPSRADGPGKI